MKKSVLLQVNFPLTNFRSLITGFLLILSPAFFAQNNVVTQLWSDTGGLQSGKFSTPTVVDGQDNLYKAGHESQSLGGTDVKLQKYNSEGTLLWDRSLNTSSHDAYEPSQIFVSGTDIYVTGIVTYISSGETDFFVSKVSQDGDVLWFKLDISPGNDVSSDIVYESSSSNIYVCGTTERNGTYDLLLASYNDDGDQNWIITNDYNGNADVGAKLNLDGGNIIVNGSSQSTPTQWDIVSWYFDDGGSLLNEERGSGLATSSDQLKDGVLSNGYINLTGTSNQGGDDDFKVVCLDANNNFLWEDTYDKNGLDDGGTAVIASNNTFTVTGFVTDAVNNSNILVRKYDTQGNLVWNAEFDKQGKNDKGDDIIEDNQGNYMVLADVTIDDQTDVYLYYLDGSTGNLIWKKKVSDDPNQDEKGISIESQLNGEIYITYEVFGQGGTQSVTESYSYSDVNFPLDNEPFSKGSLYIANSGQLKDLNEQSVTDIRYYSFGSYPDYYFADNYFSSLVGFDDSTGNPQLQRINFQFNHTNSTHVGEVTEYQRETYFNYYDNNEKYEGEGTFDVLAWPDLYNNIDAFVSSNSAGFKMIFRLKSGADLNDIDLNIEGSSGVTLNGNDLEISTINGPVTWKAPFSYNPQGNEIKDDDCIQYSYANGHLTLHSNCGELSYPYIIQIKAGVGAVYSTTAINNMDWSTFWGGNYNDIGSDIEADNSGNIYIGGMISSDVMPSGAGVTGQDVGGDRKGFILKFDQNAVIKWCSLIEPSGATRASFVRGVGLYDNINTSSSPGQEVHVVGEYTGTLDPSIDMASGVPSGAWQQTSYTQASNTTGPVRDLFFASFKNNDGTMLIISPFGGSKQEMIFAMDISANGLMYFAGSTRGGSTASASSQNPPQNYTFPVYDPGDGSYFNATHPAVGTDRGFVSAIDLNTYKLAYSSIITKDASSSKTEYKAIYSIWADGGGAFCGEGTSNYGRLGFFDPSTHKFATSLDTHPYCEWTDRQLFSSVVKSDYGYVFFGLKSGANTSLLSSTATDRYRNTQGRAYIMRIVGNTVEWDTYFGDTPYTPVADMDNWRWYIADDPWFIPQVNSQAALGGRGKITYNSATSSLFFGGSINAPHPVEAKDEPGFFYQNAVENWVNGNNSAGKPDQFLAAFSYNNLGVEDKFTWGTMYGQKDRLENFNDIVSYTVGNDSYVVTLSTVNSHGGSTTSDIDKFPLADLGLTNSWYQSSNPGSQYWYYSLGITRFKVTNLVNYVSLPENNIEKDSPWKIFPNPAGDAFRIVSDMGDPLKTVKIYDLNGQCVFENDRPGEFPASFSISNLAAGVYIVNINGKYNQKLVKL